MSTALNILQQLLSRYKGYISAALVLGSVDFHGHRCTRFIHVACCLNVHVLFEVFQRDDYLGSLEVQYGEISFY